MNEQNYENLCKEVYDLLCSYFLVLKLKGDTIYLNEFIENPYDPFDWAITPCTTISVTDSKNNFDFYGVQGIKVGINPKNFEFIIEIKNNNLNKQYEYLKNLCPDASKFNSVHCYRWENKNYRFQAYCQNTNNFCIDIIKNYIACDT